MFHFTVNMELYCHAILSLPACVFCVPVPPSVLISQGVKQGHMGALGYVCAPFSVYLGRRRV